MFFYLQGKWKLVNVFLRYFPTRPSAHGASLSTLVKGAKQPTGLSEHPSHPLARDPRGKSKERQKELQDGEKLHV